MKFTQSTWDSWNEWLEFLNSRISNLLIYSDRFKDLMKLQNINLDHINKVGYGEFLTTFKNCYITHQIIAVRKTVKRKDKKSLTKIIDQMEKCANQITLDFYLQLHPIDPNCVDWQRPTFLALSDDRVTLSEVKLSALRCDLESTCRPITDYCDKVIAHNEEAAGTIPNYDQLQTAIESIDRAYCKIAPFLTTKGYGSLRPTYLDDWTECHFSPLIVKRS